VVLKNRINLTFSLPFILKKRKNLFLSSCPILDVNSQGNTEKDAIKNLKEALSLFILTCIEMRTLDRVLKNSGFVGTKIERKRKTKNPENYIDIPINLLWNQSKKIERHA